MKSTLTRVLLLAGLTASLTRFVSAQTADAGSPVRLHIDAAKVTAHVSPTLYGLMTEEINYSYDGGLYAELIRNRTFLDDPVAPIHWQLVQDGGGSGAMALDRNAPLNTALPVSLKLDIQSGNGRVGVANDGFWGVAVRPNTVYRASVFAKAGAGFAAPLRISLESADGAMTFAAAETEPIGNGWRRYAVELRTGECTPTAHARVVVAASKPGQVWLTLVSVFPPTWHDRPNGNRTDIMQLLSAMKPTFLRFPGGNYLQGKTLATRFDWKRTLGPISERLGHLDDAWNYRSSDGMGLLEFLEWCEDLKMQPVLGVFAGFTLRGVPTKPGPDLEPFVREALEEIEYVTGDTATTWGARRAKDGHPAPFPLTYVEVGNEDFFDREPGSYDGRFAQFYDAIKAKYPKLQVIATTKVSSRTPDAIDEHFYPREPEVFESDVTHYDQYDRKGPKIFVGEWATRIGSPTPNLLAAVSDAAWMTGMERNSDIVVMHAYAPLFVNVSDLKPRTGSMQWATDLIGYNVLSSYGSPSYYAQCMFSANHGDLVLAATAENNPTREWQPPRGRNSKADAPLPAKKQVAAVYFDATRDSRSGTIFVKLVNSAARPTEVRVTLAGAGAIAPQGEAIVLTSAKPEDTNSIDAPTRVVPVTTSVPDFGTDFTRQLAPYSVSVLVLHAQ